MAFTPQRGRFRDRIYSRKDMPVGACAAALEQIFAKIGGKAHSERLLGSVYRVLRRTAGGAVILIASQFFDKFIHINSQKRRGGIQPAAPR